MHSLEMKSKCGVSPRIIAPNVMIASNFLFSINARIVTGISNAPGTLIAVIESLSTPLLLSVLIAPSYKRSTIKLLNLLETIAIFNKPL